MRRFALFLLLTASTAALMGSKHPIFPDAAYAAKTIYIDNQTGVQQTKDLVSEDITKWGRLSIANDKASADLVAAFTVIPVLVNGTTRNKIHLSLQLHGSDDVFYQDEEVSYGFHLPNNLIAEGAHKCLEKFRGRLEEKH